LRYQKEESPLAARSERVAIIIIIVKKKKRKKKREKRKKSGGGVGVGLKKNRGEKKGNSFNGNLNFSTIDDVLPVEPRHCAKNKLSNKSFP